MRRLSGPLQTRPPQPSPPNVDLTLAKAAARAATSTPPSSGTRPTHGEDGRKAALLAAAAATASRKQKNAAATPPASDKPVPSNMALCAATLAAARDEGDESTVDLYTDELPPASQAEIGAIARYWEHPQKVRLDDADSRSVAYAQMVDASNWFHPTKFPKMPDFAQALARFLHIAEHDGLALTVMDEKYKPAFSQAAPGNQIYSLLTYLCSPDQIHKNFAMRLVNVDGEDHFFLISKPKLKAGIVAKPEEFGVPKTAKNWSPAKLDSWAAQRCDELCTDDELRKIVKDDKALGRLLGYPPSNCDIYAEFKGRFNKITQQFRNNEISEEESRDARKKIAQERTDKYGPARSSETLADGFEAFLSVKPVTGVLYGDTEGNRAQEREARKACARTNLMFKKMHEEYKRQHPDMLYGDSMIDAIRKKMING